MLVKLANTALFMFCSSSPEHGGGSPDVPGNPSVILAGMQVDASFIIAYQLSLSREQLYEYETLP